MLAAYGLLMTPAVQSMVAATYVRDIDTSRASYELLGFREQSAGSAATSAWSSLHQDELSVLLTSTTPPLDIPQLPLLFYFFYDDVDVVVRVLGKCQVRDRQGRPCLNRADVKLADSMGDKAWVCLAHADEILVTVPEAFIASEDGQGLAAFLSRP